MDDKEFEIENSRLQLEKIKHANDVRLKEKEVELRIKELKGRSINPSLVTILIAVIGIVGTVFGAFLQGLSNEKVQQGKHDSEIIIKGLNLETNEKRREYLHFVAKLGLFKDKEHSKSILETTEFPMGPSSTELLAELAELAEIEPLRHQLVKIVTNCYENVPLEAIPSIWLAARNLNIIKDDVFIPAADRQFIEISQLDITNDEKRSSLYRYQGKKGPSEWYLSFLQTTDNTIVGITALATHIDQVCKPEPL